MQSKTILPLLFLNICLILNGQSNTVKDRATVSYTHTFIAANDTLGATETTPYQSAKPYTRWWWFAGIINKEDISDQLDWLKKNNFGGVEIAFIYPVNRNPKADRFEWLGKQWQDAISYTKIYADKIGLGCDFTFGTLWPFGGTFVGDSDRTQKWGDKKFKQPLRLSWTHPDTGNVLNHLDRSAFARYARVMGNAISPALKGTKSALFCDSWEVDSKHLWTEGFDRIFKKQFDYDIRPFMDSIYASYNAGPRYDYMKLISKMVLEEFYIPFTAKTHELGAFSRVQCSGAPVDLIQTYAVIDIPETEAMLYEPNFSKIVASAAALSNKNIISAETFTCLYGFPAKYIRKEQTADLKLVTDALFANGVNQIFWHGMPFNPIGVDTQYFYATVHVGKKGTLTNELAAFNDYMTKISQKMRVGRTYSDIAVYLPLEDSWIAGEYPKELQMKWSWGAYELRYERFNLELNGYHPLWINSEFLSQGIYSDGKLIINGLAFQMLYIDAKSLDIETLKIVLKLAIQGLPICLKQDPDQSGYIKNRFFETMLRKLKSLSNVTSDFQKLIKNPPLVKGVNVPEFWCRINEKSALIFFANPKTEKLALPITYGQSLQDNEIYRNISINFKGKTVPVELCFKPYQSILLSISDEGIIQFEDIEFVPKIPITEK